MPAPPARLLFRVDPSGQGFGPRTFRGYKIKAEDVSSGFFYKWMG